MKTDDDSGYGDINTDQEHLIGCDDVNDVETRTCCHGNCRTDSTCYRYTVMILLCSSVVGDYFCFDNPAALEDHILTDLNITESRYMVFYSSIQWLQTGACLFGGYLIDKVIGIRRCLVISSMLVTSSQVLFAGGAMMNSYWTMVAGRVVFGMSDGTQWLAIEKMIVRWFRNKELTFVLGLKISLGRVGTVANMNLMGPIYTMFKQHYVGHTSLGLALFVGSGVCVVSTMCAFSLCILDKAADGFISKTTTATSTDDVRLTDIRHFPATFWLVDLTVVFFLATVLTFTGLGQVFFESKYGMNSEIASNVNSIQFIIAMCAIPVIGIIVDKVGRNLVWMFVGLSCLLAAHLLLAFTFVNPYVAMSMLGLSYSITSSAIWPLVAYAVELKYIATAFGIICTSIALGQAGSTYLAGYVAENFGYITMEALFLTYSCVSLVLGSLLYIFNSAKDGTLNLTKKDRLIHEESLKCTQKNTDERKQQTHIACDICKQETNNELENQNVLI